MGVGGWVGGGGLRTFVARMLMQMFMCMLTLLMSKFPALSWSMFIFILVLLSMLMVYLLLYVDVDDPTDVDVHDANDDAAENTNRFGHFEQITRRTKRPET